MLPNFKFSRISQNVLDKKYFKDKFLLLIPSKCFEGINSVSPRNV